MQEVAEIPHWHHHHSHKRRDPSRGRKNVELESDFQELKVSHSSCTIVTLQSNSSLSYKMVLLR